MKSLGFEPSPDLVEIYPAAWWLQSLCRLPQGVAQWWTVYMLSAKLACPIRTNLHVSNEDQITMSVMSCRLGTSMKPRRWQNASHLWNETLVAIAGTTILEPYHLMHSLQHNWWGLTADIQHSNVSCYDMKSSVAVNYRYRRYKSI